VRTIIQSSFTFALFEQTIA